MKISGLQKLTALDYPGKVACIVFTAGCNLRCPFCQNSTLATGEEPLIDEGEVMSFLQMRRKLLDGVCISGGEPLLQPDVKPFIYKVKELGYSVKLDTNGTLPEKLNELLREGLLDYVAMDVKNVPEKLSLTAGGAVDCGAIDRSIDLLMKSGVDYEFRTTVVREFHTAEDVIAIAERIRGAKKYCLQSFVLSDNVFDKRLHAHSAEFFEEIKEKISPLVGEVVLR